MYTPTGASAATVIHQQISNTQTFKIPTLNYAGNIFYDYIVTVNTNYKYDQGYTSGNAFKLETYTPPTLTNLSAERYSIRPSDTGSTNILSTDNTGEYVRFSFTLTPAKTSVTSNSWTLSVKATSGSGKTQNKNSAYTGTTAGVTKTEDTTIFPSASFTFDPKEDWTFTFSIKDKVTTTSYSTQIASATSILNVEPNGVAIGGFLSTGSAFTNNNLLRGTGYITNILPKANNGGEWSDGTWGETSGGNGKITLIEVTDCPDAGVRTGIRISENTTPGGNKDISQVHIPFSLNQVYTLSCFARVESGKAQLLSRVWDRTADKLLFKIDKNISNTAWQRYSLTFTFTGGDPSNSSVQFGMWSDGLINLCGFKLEKGTVANPVWTPASQDRAEITPFSQPKRFETSDDCGAILRGGLWDGRGYRMDYVNNTTMLDYPSGFAPYAAGDEAYAAGRIPMVSRVGPIVFLEGALRVTTARQISGDVKLCTLPSWARPRMTISHVGQGSTYHIFWLRVEPNGDLILSRYRYGNTYPTVPVNSQLMFTFSWLAADAAPPLPDVT